MKSTTSGRVNIAPLSSIPEAPRCLTASPIGSIPGIGICRCEELGITYLYPFALENGAKPDDMALG